MFQCNNFVHFHSNWIQCNLIPCSIFNPVWFFKSFLLIFYYFRFLQVLFLCFEALMVLLLILALLLFIIVLRAFYVSFQSVINSIVSTSNFDIVCPFVISIPYSSVLFKLNLELKLWFVWVVKQEFAQFKFLKGNYRTPRWTCFIQEVFLS